MFLDDLSQEELDIYENRLLDTIKKLIKTLSNRTIKASFNGNGYTIDNDKLKIKFKRWSFTVGRSYMRIRGSGCDSSLAINYMPNIDYNPDDLIRLVNYYGDYYSHNLILREICKRLELKTAAEFENFINRLISEHISII